MKPSTSRLGARYSPAAWAAAHSVAVVMCRISRDTSPGWHALGAPVDIGTMALTARYLYRRAIPGATGGRDGRAFAKNSGAAPVADRGRRGATRDEPRGR